MIVMEQKYGDAAVYIHDDYCKNCTENETRIIIQKISELICNSEITKEETA